MINYRHVLVRPFAKDIASDPLEKAGSLFRRGSGTDDSNASPAGNIICLVPDVRFEALLTLLVGPGSNGGRS